MVKGSQTKLLEGMVVKKSALNPDTLKVAVRIQVRDKKYKKRIWDNKYFMVHDSECRTKVGDRIVFKETRPMSATKNHIVEHLT